MRLTAIDRIVICGFNRLDAAVQRRGSDPATLPITS